nr:hypothetical protein [Tanacetum cinerariifolium]
MPCQIVPGFSDFNVSEALQLLADRLYLSSSSPTSIIDDDGILALKQMKTDQRIGVPCSVSYPNRGRKATLMIVGYGQDVAALSPECEEGGISQHYSLLNAYITAKAPDFRFKERLKADNVFPGESLAAQLA